MEVLVVFALYLHSSLMFSLHKGEYYSVDETRFFATAKSNALITLQHPDTL